MSPAVARRQQHLPDDVGSTQVAGEQAYHRREPAACTPATHRELARSAAERLGVVGDPLHRGHGVIDRGGESVLGRVAVVRRDDDRVAAHAKIPAQRIIRDSVTQNPTAAMEVHDDRVRARGRRPVQPVRQIACGAGQDTVDDLANVRARRSKHLTSACRRRGRPPTAIDSINGRFSAAISLRTISTSGCNRRTTPSVQREPLGPDNLKPR